MEEIRSRRVYGKGYFFKTKLDFQKEKTIMDSLFLYFSFYETLIGMDGKKTIEWGCYWDILDTHHFWSCLCNELSRNTSLLRNSWVKIYELF